MKLFCLSIICFTILLCNNVSFCEETKTEKTSAISKTQALEIAKENIRGKINIPSEIRPIVLEEDNKYIIVFPTHLQPDVRGPDYHARIDIDKFTGEVLKTLAGS